MIKLLYSRKRPVDSLFFLSSSSSSPSSLDLDFSIGMDSKSAKTERPEEGLISSWSALLGEKVTSPNKSFMCSFCKKEFSNAQALGGHMNIHRRDRARLRNSEDEEQISMITSTASTLSHHDQVVFKEKDHDVVILESSSSHKTSSNFGTSTSASKFQPVGRSSATELDLELRLGLEPPKRF